MTVRTFTDPNGATRLVASIVPEPTFNGGTITDELIVDTAATNDQALELTGTRTSEHDILRIDYPHTVVVVDSDGVASFTSDDHMEVSAIGTSGSGAAIAALNYPGGQGAAISSASGVVYFDGTNFTVQLGPTGFLFQMNSAPADGDLVAGDCALWFDKTNGAAKLMLKGKTANGTVVTAAIALA